jgi:hypothetical protein
MKVRSAAHAPKVRSAAHVSWNADGFESAIEIRVKISEREMARDKISTCISGSYDEIDNHVTEQS